MILAKPRGHKAVIPSQGPCVHVYEHTAQHKMTISRSTYTVQPQGSMN